MTTGVRWWVGKKVHFQITLSNNQAEQLNRLIIVKCQWKRNQLLRISHRKKHKTYWNNKQLRWLRLLLNSFALCSNFSELKFQPRLPILQKLNKLNRCYPQELTWQIFQQCKCCSRLNVESQLIQKVPRKVRLRIRQHNKFLRKLQLTCKISTQCKWCSIQWT